MAQSADCDLRGATLSPKDLIERITELSAIAPAQRRVWVPLAAGAVMVGMITAATLTGAAHRGGTRSSSTENAGVAAAQQADWKISIHPAGVTGKLSKSEKLRIAHQRHALRGVVRDLYGALFFNPARVDNVLSSRFSKASATSFRRAHAGIPKDMSNVTTKRRAARVSVQASGAKRAVADVTVVASGNLEGRAVKILHRSRLWLERTGRHWKIIAFDVDQRPVK
jgi:hypothetical protein